MQNLRRVLLGLCTCVTIAAGSPLSFAQSKQSGAPTDLRIEGAETLLGMDVAAPRFSWLASSGKPQTHYRIQVAASEADLTNGTLVWDSGLVASRRHDQIAYAGPGLVARGRYVWRVKTQSEGGSVGEWSRSAVWEMGLLDRADWQARWISGSLPVQHVWSDAVTEWSFTAGEETVSFLFRASPVGQGYDEAYVWRLELGGSSPRIEAISRRYDPAGRPLVKETALKTIVLPATRAQMLAGRHTLTVEAAGPAIVTRLDGVVIDRLENADHRQGTAGIFQPEARRPSPTGEDTFVLHSLKVTPPTGAPTFTDFARNDNPLTGGTVLADGLRIANARGVNIVFPQAGPAALLRKSFAVPGAVAKARLYAAAGGFPRIDINGQTINEAIADGFTAYDRRVLYRTFDVTDRLQRGDNTIGVELGRGWYDLSEPNKWYWHATPWRDRPSLLLQLELTLADGTRQVISSDEGWRVSPGPTLHDSIYAGERYDARLVPVGWSKPGFDDRGWQRASVVSGPKGQLDAAEQQPIGVTETLRPKTVKEVKPGVWIFDFGRIFAGRVRLKVQGPAGQTVSLMAHEKLRGDGTVLSASGLVDTQLQTDRYTLAGTGVEEWAPSFSYGGFRYVEVRGYPGTPGLDSLSGEVMHSTVASIGDFSSSNALLDQIQAAARATILNNMHGFQTDTPTFEKNGWTGDAQASALASALNFDVARVWTKWMADFRDAQSPNGEIPEIVPSTPLYGYENTPGWSMINGPTPSWDAATFVLPEDLHNLTGDLRMIAEMYGAQKKLVDYTLSWFTPHDFRYRQVANVFLGEYAYPMPPITPEMIAALAKPSGSGPAQPGPSNVDSVSGAYLFYMTDRLAKNAELLGKRADARIYAAKAKEIRVAFNHTYWDAGRGFYRVPVPADKQPDFVQYLNILPVAFGMAPEGAADAILQKVNDDIVAHDYHLSSMGVFSGRHALTLLTDHGHVDTVYRVATQTTAPSWGFWLANDIHTMLEGWGLDTRSYDHHYWGLISSWFYQGLAGIRPGRPGYETIVIRPAVPRGLDQVSASLDTVQGRVSSKWRQHEGLVTLDVTIPAGTPAEVWCPGRATQAPAGAHRLRRSSGYEVFRVMGGSHRFECGNQHDLAPG